MPSNKNIICVHGKEILTYPGKLKKLHEIGFNSLASEMIQFPNSGNDYYCIVRAEIQLKNGITVSALGDASPDSVPPATKSRFISVAETRAKSRAINDACDLGDTDNDMGNGNVLDVEFSSTQKPVSRSPNAGGGNKPATNKQISFVSMKANELGHDVSKICHDEFNKDIDQLQGAEADQFIKMLSKMADGQQSNILQVD